MKHLLSRLVKDPQLEQLSLDLNIPNVFNILNISKAEIRHSNFLAWLLSPSESHNLNSLFLKWFLKEICSSEKVDWIDEFSVENLNLNGIEVFREWRNIDILIKHDDFVIVVENKVDSIEHSNQLSRYKDVVETNFPNCEKVFVFLTINGVEPKKESDSDCYISIDYSLIKNLIEMILSLYSTSLSERVKIYIEDYLLILKRYIMLEHESVDLARQLYKNHKEALDFIYDNIPDDSMEIGNIIKKSVQDLGFVLETCNKGYVRFLTKNLSSIIPKTGIMGWRNQESFLFEIAYTDKSISLKFVISPGEENNKRVLADIIKKVAKNRNASGKHWLTYYSDSIKHNIKRDFSEGRIEQIEQRVSDLIDNNKEKIDSLEKAILEVEDQFIY